MKNMSLYCHRYVTNTKRSQSCCFKDKQKPISWAHSLDVTHSVIQNHSLTWYLVAAMILLYALVVNCPPYTQDLVLCWPRSRKFNCGGRYLSNNHTQIPIVTNSPMFSKERTYRNKKFLVGKCDAIQRGCRC